MTKSDEIKLRHEFEANCRHDGLNTALTALGNYADPGVQGMWGIVKGRGKV